jgi:hypothetical protein
MNDNEFDDYLRTADDPVSLPPSFQYGVWQRIESRKIADIQPQILVFHPLAARRVSPWMAGIGVAAMVTLGLWLGAVTAPDANDAKLTYAESISPFASTHRK